MIRPKTRTSFQRALCCFCMSGAAALAQTPLTTVPFAEGLSIPLFVTAPPGDFERVFVVERGGRVEIIRDGAVLLEDFVQIESLLSSGGERGLLGMAFHPRYADNGEFFLNFTNLDGNIEVARFRVTEDPDVADPAGQTVLIVTHPNDAPNHYGGWIGFGPDGLLYVAVGDGAFDPQYAQDITNNLLGKILRVDVDGDDFPTDPDRNYAIPPDNPFVGVAGDDEILAYGLRNPWRCGFDSLSGDLYIGDVGSARWEEIDLLTSASPGGENYGWPIMEGNFCGPELCTPPGITLPILTLGHEGTPYCAITGGEVYRGCAIEDLRGTYFFGEFCSGQVFSLRYPGQVTDLRNRTAELAPDGATDLGFLVSFGHDAAGEIFICDFAGGVVHKIVAADLPTLDAVFPEDGAIDARRPLIIVNPSKFLSGWTQWSVRLDPPSACPRHEAFYLRTVGGSLEAPALVALEPEAGDVFTLRWDRPLEVLTWTEVVHEDSRHTRRLGALPGDVNGDGIAEAGDVVALVDSLSGRAPPLAEWSADLDRSTRATGADILESVDLLLGLSGFPPFDGRSLP